MTYRCHTPIHPVAWRLHLPNLPDPALPCKLQGSLSVFNGGQTFWWKLWFENDDGLKVNGVNGITPTTNTNRIYNSPRNEDQNILGRLGLLLVPTSRHKPWQHQISEIHNWNRPIAANANVPQLRLDKSLINPTAGPIVYHLLKSFKAVVTYPDCVRLGSSIWEWKIWIFPCCPWGIEGLQPSCFTSPGRVRPASRTKKQMVPQIVSNMKYLYRMGGSKHHRKACRLRNIYIYVYIYICVCIHMYIYITNIMRDHMGVLKRRQVLTTRKKANKNCGWTTPKG